MCVRDDRTASSYHKASIAVLRLGCCAHAGQKPAQPKGDKGIFSLVILKPLLDELRSNARNKGTRHPEAIMKGIRRHWFRAFSPLDPLLVAKRFA